MRQGVMIWWKKEGLFGKQEGRDWIKIFLSTSLPQWTGKRGSLAIANSLVGLTNIKVSRGNRETFILHPSSERRKTALFSANPGLKSSLHFVKG